MEIFQDLKIRRIFDEKTEAWFFSVIDIITILTDKDYKQAKNYWSTLKSRLKKEGSEVVTNIEQMKLPAANGKKYLTDVANVETLVNLISFIPSPKVKPVKIWLAKVGYKRIQNIVQADEKIRARAAKRMKENGSKKGGKVGA